jgi:hypothetical protein
MAHNIMLNGIQVVVLGSYGWYQPYNEDAVIISNHCVASGYTVQINLPFCFIGTLIKLGLADE